MPWEEGAPEDADGTRNTPSPVGPWLPDWSAGAGSRASAAPSTDWEGLSPREAKLVRYVSRLLRQRDAQAQELEVA